MADLPDKVDLISEMLSDLDARKKSKAEFLANLDLIQAAVNEHAPVAFIWKWLYSRHLYTHSYNSFLRTYKLMNMQSKTKDEIERDLEFRQVRSLI